MPTIFTQQDIEHNTELLLQASTVGDLDEVKRLIPISDPKARGSYPLRKSAHHGHTECVKLLIPVSHPKELNSDALLAAVRSGHPDIVKLLIPVSNPKAKNSYALRLAVQQGHIECVKLLIPVSDPKTYNSEALLGAAKLGQVQIIKLLIPVSDYNHVLEHMQRDKKDTTLLQQYIDEYEILQQKERLISQLTSKAIEAPHSIKRKM